MIKQVWCWLTTGHSYRQIESRRAKYHHANLGIERGDTFVIAECEHCGARDCYVLAQRRGGTP